MVLRRFSFRKMKKKVLKINIWLSYNSENTVCWSTLTANCRWEKIFEFLHCPFEGRANMHHKIQPNWQTGRCCLAGGSKGQCRKSKKFLSLLLPIKEDTCFASTISEPEFTVWVVQTQDIDWFISWLNWQVSISGGGMPSFYAACIV